MRIPLFLIALFFFLLEGTPAIATSDSLQQAYQDHDIRQHVFDQDKWKKATEGLDYTDHRAKPKEPIEETKPVEIPQIRQEVIIALFVVILAVLIFLLLRAMGVSIFLKKKDEEIKSFALENFSDRVPESELERWLREALQQGDFRLAVRIYYLMIIKELSDQKWITWRKEKTNHDYWVEMKKKEHRRTFSDVTRIFERTWYGEHAIDAQNFHEASGKFSSFISTIKNSQ
jgi:Domain of unknown function (DUF4129)